MITAEISITPVGTCSTSISEFVAESEKILQKYTDTNLQSKHDKCNYF
jgi:uncharacterized protein YqgV (UPF0045/DUF77 family)